jgi:hypothetical protein
MSRWVELYATSPSGKTLFVCRFCGRTSPCPDKDCATPPSVVAYKPALPCIVLEEIELIVSEAVVEVPKEDRKNKTHYTITLTSPTTAEISWLGGRGYTKRSHFTIKSEKIYELTETMKADLVERISKADESTELERKHL